MLIFYPSNTTLPSHPPILHLPTPGAGDLTGDPFGYVTGVLAVIIHASYLVLIQKASGDSDHGPLTAQYTIAIIASPVLLVCALVSKDAVDMWSYSGWKNPSITGIFVTCIVIGCAMNFTTLHCTYINSAVTTSFVGVVKSIATITVGMLAFSDVAPTHLFIAGVVVNTVGSITYCVVKYCETKKKVNYQDMDEAAKQDELPGQPYTGPTRPDGDAEAGANLANGTLETGAVARSEQAPFPALEHTDQERIEMQKQAYFQEGGEPVAQPQSLSDSYLGVWRSVRTLKYVKKDTLIDNMEVQSP